MLRYAENIRGEQVFEKPEAKPYFEQDKAFSVMIFNGKGELFFKKIDGFWYEKILTVDKCFGVMMSKFRKLKI